MEKSIVTSLSLDSVPLMARLIIAKELKQKCGRLSKRVNKRGRN